VRRLTRLHPSLGSDGRYTADVGMKHRITRPMGDEFNDIPGRIGGEANGEAAHPGPVNGFDKT
jgi:hypothetical protein